MTINISRIEKLGKACSIDATRPALTAPYLRITEKVTGKGKTRKVAREGVVCATDSYIAVSITVPVDDDETEGVVPLAAIAFARSLKDRTAEIKLVGDRAEVWASGGEQASFPRVIIAAFPDFAKIDPVGDPIVVFGVSPQLLLNAAQALGATTAVRIEVLGPLKPLRVTVSGDNGGVALVMTTRIRP